MKAARGFKSLLLRHVAASFVCLRRLLCFAKKSPARLLRCGSFFPKSPLDFLGALWDLPSISALFRKKRKSLFAIYYAPAARRRDSPFLLALPCSGKGALSDGRSSPTKICGFLSVNSLFQFVVRDGALHRRNSRFLFCKVRFATTFCYVLLLFFAQITLQQYL